MKRCIYCGVSRKSHLTSCPRCGKEYRDLISIDQLPFAKVDPVLAEKYLKRVQNGEIDMYKADVKKLEEAIRAGTFCMADALYDGEVEFMSGDSGYRYSIKLMSMEGDPVDTQVNVWGNVIRGAKESETGKVHVFRMSFKGKKRYYVSAVLPDVDLLEEMSQNITYLANSSEKRYCAGLADAIFGV